MCQYLYASVLDINIVTYLYLSYILRSPRASSIIILFRRHAMLFIFCAGFAMHILVKMHHMRDAFSISLCNIEDVPGQCKYSSVGGS